MHKISEILKYILLVLTIFLCILFMFTYKIGNLKILIIGIILLVILIISLRDIKFKRITSTKYNFLLTIILLITSILFIRSMFDTSLIINKNNLEILNNYEEIRNTTLMHHDIGLRFLTQNFYFLLILYISIIVYHLIDTRNTLKRSSKYSYTSIICLIINILLIPEIFVNFELSLTESFPLLFLTTTIILLVVEITSLIRNNHLKKEWPIYICFFFNLFSLISIIF